MSNLATKKSELKKFLNSSRVIDILLIQDNGWTDRMLSFSLIFLYFLHKVGEMSCFVMLPVDW